MIKRSSSCSVAAPAVAVRGRAQGSVLIETLAAIVLFALAVGPLAAAIVIAKERSENVRSRTESAIFLAPTEEFQDAWNWGAGLVAAEWQPGPVLELTVGQREETSRIIGLWLNGWFVGEHEPDDEGRLILEGRIVTDHVGAEVVARVRVPGGLWGAPWRSVVPESLAAAAEQSMTAVAPAAGPGVEAEEILIHAPGHANPWFEVSDPTMTLVTDGSVLPQFVWPKQAGEYAVGLAGMVQRWKAEENRGLDFFF